MQYHVKIKSKSQFGTRSVRNWTRSRFWCVFLFGFSTQIHATSYQNHINKSLWDLKCAKFNEKSWFGHVQKSRACPGPVQKDKSLSARQAFTFFLVITPFFVYQQIHDSKIRCISLLRNHVFTKHISVFWKHRFVLLHISHFLFRTYMLY